MIRLVLFDIDGTLVHTGRAGVKAFARIFAEEFGVPNGVEKLRFGGRTDFSLVREFFTNHQIHPSRENFSRFFDQYAFWLDHILATSQTSECPGVRSFLQDVRGLPEPPLIGLLTGNVRIGAEIKLRHFNLWDEFETGAFGDDHEDRDKIAAIAFERGRRVLGGSLERDEVLVIGDTPLDIRCGRAIGARVLAVATGGAKFEELKEHRPDWLVENLSQLRAQMVCDGARERVER